MIGTFHASGELLHMWTRPALKSSMARLSSRVVVSESALETARANWYDAEYVVLWNGIEVDRFADAVPTPTERPAAFFIGRHEPRKGLEVLLDAWRTLDRDAVLWVGGAGPQTEELRAATRSESVEWLGAITDAERDLRLRGASAWCCSREWRRVRRSSRRRSRATRTSPAPISTRCWYRPAT
jgi:phosphatidylinositol alpha-mannosyltransferase